MYKRMNSGGFDRETELSRLPLYQQVREQIMEDIVSRDLPANTLYLSEAQAMEKFQVSRVTVRQAFELLEREGYLYRIRGKGTFVAPHDAKLSGTVALMTCCVVRNGVDVVLLRAIEEYFDAHDVNVIICNSDSIFTKAERYLKRLVKSNIDGLIFMPIASDTEYARNEELLLYVANQNIPCIQIDRYVDSLRHQIISVAPDNFQGAYEMVRHLVRIGHRLIGFCGTRRSSSVEDRYQGFRKAMDVLGVPVQSMYCRPVSNENNLRDVAEYYAGLDTPPTAVFCASDDRAFRLIEAFSEIGIRVPEDIAVTGFDDHQRKRCEDMKLTTVHAPLVEEGSAAASIMLDLIRKKPVAPGPVTLPCDLIVRESCGVKLRAENSPDESLSTQPFGND